VLIPEAIAALEEREAAFEAVQLLRDELTDREASLAKASAAAAAHQPGSPSTAGLERKAAAATSSVAQLQVRARLLWRVCPCAWRPPCAPGHFNSLLPHAPTQDRLQAAAKHYEQLKARNMAELERLSLERADDFRAALRRVADVQAQMADAVGDVWRAAAGGAPRAS
jgi:hypothetical protein